MSVIRFKSEREKRSNFASLSSILSRLGLTDMKRKADSEASGTTTQSNSPTKKRRCPKGYRRVPPKTGECQPKGSVTPERKPHAPEVVAVMEPPTLNAYHISGATIQASKIIKLLYDGRAFTGKKFCWRLEEVRRRKPTEFSGITKMFYFPQGNIFEDDALDLIDKFLPSKMTRQTQQGGDPKPYEKDALMRIVADAPMLVVGNSHLFIDGYTFFSANKSVEEGTYQILRVIYVLSAILNLISICLMVQLDTVGDSISMMFCFLTVIMYVITDMIQVLYTTKICSVLENYKKFKNSL